MVIVAGHLIVDPAGRTQYLAGCTDAVRAARAAPGCLDFALGADLLDPARVNVFERWTSPAALAAFRGQGPSEGQLDEIRRFSIDEFVVGRDA
ncbi:putative quinol monooxygenase [Nakamurella multipartita]|jgi:quinol monooxygenase YgiN|uniref:Antibiotic biosynthesis monooxygenase n=1 Tax=Nakamurella multipartita (strain ATCC 700099 / DSM 44233 / CIP 104796 / JCM 9543 / NBRC 105858 / Y-104) TaxID=479431 RepID=C8XJD5_NAKMY|nr:antibiotic biosynthesis monooxygenase [Nakamurella multipartita]ACV78600.1 Antibiotic biosynthesis monooxygenase [Nakamurella multipartita DSM 44233]HOZ58869.1 antibiotic biosynthesis monooxygenase [Nakamurella multipartita]